MDFFLSARVKVDAQAIGVSQAALDAARDYDTEREQFAQPIADFVRHMLAEIREQDPAGRILHVAGNYRSHHAKSPKKWADGFGIKSSSFRRIRR